MYILCEIKRRKKEINIDLLVFQLLIEMSKNKLGNKLSEERGNRIDCLYLWNFLLSLFPHIWHRHYHVADLKKEKNKIFSHVKTSHEGWNFGIKNYVKNF